MVKTLNLALRFFLELAALAIMAVWGWQQAGGALRVVLAAGVPLVAAALWGIFRVPNDPGPAPVRTPGLIRLALEALFFGFATWALYDLGAPLVALAFGLVTLVHYAVAFDRLRWLVRQ